MSRAPLYPEAWVGRARVPPAPSASRVVSIDEWASRAPRRKRGLRSTGVADIDRALEEVDEMKKRGDWGQARPRHLVALYYRLHAHVYQAEPAELRGKVWTAACLMAARLLEREFKGETQRMVSFIGWAWGRERRAHAGSDNPDRRRLGWKLAFSPALVTDYRVHLQQGRRAV